MGKGYMSLKSFLIICIFTFRVLTGIAQPINNTAAYRSVSGSKYIRFYYDNDFFTSTDENYTQGILLEVAHPGLRKFPFSKLLISLRESEIKYGIAVEHLAYSPGSIRHEEIIYGDRPFAATLTLNTFKISRDTIHGHILSSSINAGVLGKWAGGEWMQKTIHRNLNNIEPLGWDNQIGNDLIINYEITFEKELTSYKKNFLVYGISTLNAGTATDNLNAGLCFMLGRFDNPFKTANISEKDLHYKLYSSSMISLIGYDATLQGGLFNDKSPYTISSADLSRIVLSTEAGITVQYKRIFLEYFQEIKSREFNTGVYHRWGGIRLGLVM